MMAADRQHEPRMTVPRRTTATRWGAAAVLAAAFVVVGCKSKDNGRPELSQNDPLIGGPGRIPKQNIPMPDAGGTAGGRRGDPLLGSPAGRSGSTGYSYDPQRWKGSPFIPSAATTPAALAGRPKDDGEGLKIETPGGTTLTPTGGSMPATTAVPSAPALEVSSPQFAELATYGVRRGDYSMSREDGQAVFRVKVAMNGASGYRGYEGRGATEAAAIKQALDQIQADRK